MKLISVTEDAAGKHRARVQLDDGDCVFVKFDEAPSEEAAFAAAELAQAARDAAAAPEEGAPTE